MRHVCSNKVACSESAAKAELSGQDTCGYNASKPPSVIAWVCRMSPTDPKKVKHSALRFKNRATTNRADFDARHRDADLEITVVTSSRQHCQA